MDRDPPPSRVRPWRWAFAFLLLAGLAFLVWRTTRSSDVLDRGLVVHVEVVDSEGSPLGHARVQRRFDPGWIRTDARGRIVLDRVPLRAGEEPSPTSVAAALDVEAPFHALRRGQTPTVLARDDGSWLIRYALEAFGRLRLRIASTDLPGIRARVEPDTVLARVEAEGGVEVARLDQPAAWRIYPGLDVLRVKLDGVTGTAAHVRDVPAPPPGTTRELELEAEPALPIQGRILAVGTAWPHLVGLIRVFQITEEGAGIEMDGILVNRHSAGSAVASFEIPFTGAGRYRLVPDFADADVPALTASGGESVELVPTRIAPWVVFDGAAWTDDVDTRLRLHYEPLAQGDTTPAQPTQPAEPTWVWVHPGDRIAAGLPRAGRYRLTFFLPGTRSRPPRVASVDTEVGSTGPHRIEVPHEDTPWGTVSLRPAAEPGSRRPAANTGTAGAASVTLLEPSRRAATILPGLADEARFEHVRAGPVALRLAWRDRTRAAVYLAGTLEEGATLALEAAPVEGGNLELTGRGPGVLGDGRARRLIWEAGASPHGEASGSLWLVRTVGTARWRTAERLHPGSWSAFLQAGTEEDAPRVPVSFEIRPGETTLLEIDVP